MTPLVFWIFSLVFLGMVTAAEHKLFNKNNLKNMFRHNNNHHRELHKNRPKWGHAGWADFVPYPDDASPLLAQEEINFAEVAPQITVLTSLPEPSSKQDIMPAMRPLAVRNSHSKLMKLQPIYMMSNGLDMGCRMPDGNSKEGHKPMQSPICDDHCTHLGRYCPAELPADLAARTKHRGRELILEIVRRLCWGSSLPGHYANRLWFEYLEQFDTRTCLDSSDLLNCSQTIMTEKLQGATDVDPAEVQKSMAECVAEADADTDTPNPMLETQLKMIKVIPYTWDDLPVLDLNGDMFDAGYRADHVLHSWCDHFPTTNSTEHNTVSRPISCDFCTSCNYEHVCLWINSCDRHDFNITTYKDPKHLKPTLVDEIVEDAEVVIEDAEVVIEDATLLIIGAVAGGVVVFAICLVLAKRRRQQAIDEVAKELPVEGFHDRGGNGGEEGNGYHDDDDNSKNGTVELPDVS